MSRSLAPLWTYLSERQVIVTTAPVEKVIDIELDDEKLQW